MGDPRSCGRAYSARNWLLEKRRRVAQRSRKAYVALADLPPETKGLASGTEVRVSLAKPVSAP